MRTKDYFLIDEFSKVKFPLFAKLTLIYFNFVFLNVFKSWFKPFSDRNYIYKYFRKLMFVSSLVGVMTLFMYFIISLTVLLVTLRHQELNLGVKGIILGYTVPMGFVIIFNFIYQPLILMHFQKKLKQHYINYMGDDFDQNIVNTLEYQKMFIENKKILLNIKNNLFSNSTWNLFYNEPFIYDKNDDNELKAISNDNNFFNSIIPRNSFLFTVPSWYICLIYNFVDNKNKKKLNIIGWVWYLISFILIAIAISLFIFFCLLIFNSDLFLMLDHIESTKKLMSIFVWFIPFIYIIISHLLGLIVNMGIKNNFLKNIDNNKNTQS